MSAITVGGDLVHYEVLGRGRQVILVHGWVGSWRYWIPVMQQLQARYRVYALDLYGFGDSGRNAYKYPLEHQVELLADFMNKLGLPKAALIGHGLGALLAAEFARRYSDRIPRLMLVSAPLFDPGDLDRRASAGRRILPNPARQDTAPPPDPNPDSPTVMSPSAAMRAALVEAARSSRKGQPPSYTDDYSNHNNNDVTLDRSELLPSERQNPMAPLLNDPEGMLVRCFRRSEPEYDKLLTDVEKTDPLALQRSMDTFDAGRMLDTLRLLPMPTVVLQGQEDQLIKPPTDAIWHYITVDKEELLVPIPMPSVRHFPMLETDRFIRLALDFLESDDLSKLAFKERWVRRGR